MVHVLSDSSSRCLILALCALHWLLCPMSHARPLELDCPVEVLPRKPMAQVKRIFGVGHFEQPDLARLLSFPPIVPDPFETRVNPIVTDDPLQV